MNLEISLILVSRARHGISREKRVFASNQKQTEKLYTFPTRQLRHIKRTLKTANSTSIMQATFHAFRDGKYTKKNLLLRLQQNVQKIRQCKCHKILTIRIIEANFA